MAGKFEKGCEGPIFTDVRPGKEEASSLRVKPDRTYLVLDRAGSEERATFARGKHPLGADHRRGELYPLRLS